MAYLDGSWAAPDNECFAADEWVPDLDLAGWTKRGRGLPLRAAWATVSGPTPKHIAEFDALGETAKLQYLDLLGRDIASAQREQFFYRNALEQLKDNPDDKTADAVIDRLKLLGFTSVGFPDASGGPPRHESPRPFRKVLDWLLRQLAKVGRFLLNAVAVITASLHEFGLSAVAVDLALPPGLSVELPVNLFRDAARWPRAKKFLDGYLEETAQRVFAPAL